jgi:hypothetical protein
VNHEEHGYFRLKADRLLSVLLLLQAKGRLTARVAGRHAAAIERAARLAAPR